MKMVMRTGNQNSHQQLRYVGTTQSHHSVQGLHGTTQSMRYCPHSLSGEVAARDDSMRQIPPNLKPHGQDVQFSLRCAFVCVVPHPIQVAEGQNELRAVRWKAGVNTSPQINGTRTLGHPLVPGFTTGTIKVRSGTKTISA